MLFLLSLILITISTAEVCVVGSFDTLMPICNVTSNYGDFRNLTCVSSNGRLDCTPQCQNIQTTGGLDITYVCYNDPSLTVSTECAKDCFNGSTCVGKDVSGTPLPGCLCDKYNVSYNRICDLNGVSSSSINSTVVSVANKILDYIPPVSNLLPFQSQSSKKRAILSTISFDIPVIHITTPVSGTGSVNARWSYLDSNGWITCNWGACNYKYDYSIFSESGVLLIVVFINDIMDSNATFVIPAESTCATACFMCVEVFTKWNCHSTISQFVAVLVILVLLLLILVMFYYLAKALFCCLVPYCMPAGPSMVINNQLAPTNDINNGPNVQDPNFWELMKRKIALKNISNQDTTMCLLIFMLCFSVAPVEGQLCTDGLVLSSSLTNCLLNGTQETCSFSQDTLITLPFVGSTVCLTYKSSIADVVIGKVFITYTKMLKKVSLQHNYYTAPWTGVQQSGTSCYNSNGCHSGECAAFNACPTCYPATGVDNNFAGMVLLYPGVSRCDAQCGCAGCGCFFCDSKCVYSRSAYQPSSTIYDVLTPFTTILQPTINFTFVNGSNIQTFMVDILGTNNVFNNTYSVQVIGSLSGSSTEFGSRKIIVGNNIARVGAASEANSPQRNLPGDIQGATISSLTQPTRTSFIFASNLATPSFSSSQTTYQFSQNGIITLQNGQYTRLPAIIGSVLYTFSQGSLVGEDSSPGAILTRFQSSIPIKFTRTINVVCPDILNITVDGCYSCLTGARFVVYSRSTCSPGFAVASVVSSSNITILSPSVSIETTPGMDFITFSTNQKFLSGILKLCADSLCDEIAFTAVLSDPQTIIDTPESSGNSSTNNNDSNDFIDWFNGLTGSWVWAKWVIMVIIIILVLAFLAALAYAFYFYWYLPRQTDYKIL